MKKTKIQQTSTRGRWGVVIIVLIVLAIISFISALIAGVFLSGTDVDPTGNVAHIQVTGPIVAHADSGFGSFDMADSTELVRLIRKADGNPDVQALLIEINSPGGTAVVPFGAE